MNTSPRGFCGSVWILLSTVTHLEGVVAGATVVHLVVGPGVGGGGGGGVLGSGGGGGVGHGVGSGAGLVVGAAVGLLVMTGGTWGVLGGHRVPPTSGI